MRKLATFAERLRDALEKSGKSAADVYKSLGVSKATWYTWAGQRESVPDPDTCIRLATLLNVSNDWLVTGNGDRAIVKKPYSQEQIDLAEAWPHLSPLAQKQIASLLRDAVIDIVPTLKSSLQPSDDELQKRADRLLEEAQARYLKSRA